MDGGDVDLILRRQERQYYNQQAYAVQSYQSNNFNYNYDYNADYGQPIHQQNQNNDICENGSYRSMMNSDDKFFNIESIVGTILLSDAGRCAVGLKIGCSRRGSGGSSGRGSRRDFGDTIKRIFQSLFRKKSFHGQNELINKSTGQVVSCTELKTFINNEYNKYFQNPVNYQRNNFDQNTDGGYGGVYGSGYNDGYRNGGDYSQTYGGQWGTSGYGIGNNNGNLGGYNVGGYGYSGGYG